MEKCIKILFIDDESDYTQPMSFWFKSKGYSTIVANSGEAGVKMVKDEAPDIVFLDLNMPVVDGTETLRRIREFNKELPIIIVSAYVEDQLRIREVNALGISGIFYKGKEFEDGLSILEFTLKSHKKLKK